ncbi:hypothetical protein [Roseibium polysiphoniae]|nr:hypothetical protein [Roseibium polysiphoniae]
MIELIGVGMAADFAASLENAEDLIERADTEKVSLNPPHIV